MLCLQTLISNTSRYISILLLEFVNLNRLHKSRIFSLPLNVTVNYADNIAL